MKKFSVFFVPFCWIVIFVYGANEEYTSSMLTEDGIPYSDEIALQMEPTIVSQETAFVHAAPVGIAGAGCSTATSVAIGTGVIVGAGIVANTITNNSTGTSAHSHGH